MEAAMTEPSLETIGYEFIDANGDEGVGVLLEERDRLRSTISDHKAAMREALSWLKTYENQPSCPAGHEAYKKLRKRLESK
jgi:hypothetical protein